jgi:hypothetical protein
MLARREEGGGLHWNHPGATPSTSWHTLAGHRATGTIPGHACLSPRRRTLPHPPDADGLKSYLSTPRLCHPRTSTAVLHHTTPTWVPRIVACLAGLALPPIHPCPSHTKRWPATSPHDQQPEPQWGARRKKDSRPGPDRPRPGRQECVTNI